MKKTSLDPMIPVVLLPRFPIDPNPSSSFSAKDFEYPSTIKKSMNAEVEKLVPAESECKKKETLITRCNRIKSNHYSQIDRSTLDTILNSLSENQVKRVIKYTEQIALAIRNDNDVTVAIKDSSKKFSVVVVNYENIGNLFSEQYSPTVLSLSVQSPNAHSMKCKTDDENWIDGDETFSNHKSLASRPHNLRKSLRIKARKNIQNRA